MATVIQIKRPTSGTSDTAPTSSNITNAELAYVYGTANQTNGGQRLYIGNAAGNGVHIIGGEYFTQMLDHAPGTLTNGSALIANASGQINELKVGVASSAGKVDFLEGDGGTSRVRIQAPNALSGDVTLTLPVDDGSSNQFLQTNGSGVMSWATVTSDFTLSDGSNTDSFSTGETLTFTGGEGIDTAVASNTVTITAETATDANLGVAKFNANDFAVTSGDVTIKAGGITNAQLAGSIANAKLAFSAITIGSTSTSLGGTSTAIAGVTQLTVDNVDINGNTISTTDTDGNLVLDPNGSGAINASNSKIINVTDPTQAQDAATKSYVDATKSGLDVKDSVRIATTAALDAVTYSQSAGTLTRSGGNGSINSSTGMGQSVTLAANDRVLVKNQAETRQNGIYTVTTVGSGSAAFVLTRSTDCDATSEFTGGTFTFVEEGTNAENGYVFTHNGTPTLTDNTLSNNTELPVSQFSGAGQITAGTGLTKSGNTINVVGGTTIDADANAIHVNSSGTANQILLSAGTAGTEATWGSLPLGNSNAVSGTLAVGTGGTGVASWTAGDMIYASGATTLAGVAKGSAGQFMTTNGTAPSWTSTIDAGTF